MHGLKKRRKRTPGGVLNVDGLTLDWKLVSEPQWSNSGRGYIGLYIAVSVAGPSRRALLIELPYPTDSAGRYLPVPQRPRIDAAIVTDRVRDALTEGWDPGSRGRTYRYRVPEMLI